MNILDRASLQNYFFVPNCFISSHEKKILIKLKNLFSETLKHSPHNYFRIQYLCFSRKSCEVSFLEKIKLAYIILKTRGLLRVLIFIYPISSTLDNEQIYNLSRMKIIKLLARNRRYFLANIFSNISLDFPDLKKLQEIAPVSEIQTLNLEDLKRLKNEEEILFRIRTDKKYIFRPNSGSSFTVNQLFLHGLMVWNSPSVFNFIRKHQLEDQSRKYFNKFYPGLNPWVDGLRSIKVRELNGYNKLLKLDFENDQELPFHVIANAEIWHQFLLVAENELIVHDITSHPSQSFVAGQWKFITGFDRKNNTCLIKIPLESTIFVSDGIFLAGRCDENWYHFLIDTLPRILFLDKIPSNIPLLIRADIPASSKKFLASITSRPIIEISPHTTLKIENLYVVPGRSSTFDSKPPRGSAVVDFPTEILKNFKSLVVSQLPSASEHHSEFQVHPYRALTRQSRTRNIQNWKSILKEFNHFDFDVTETNLDFFDSQVTYFAHSKVIVSPGGAALANTIFMSPHSVIVVLRSWRNRKLDLWVKLAKAIDVECLEVVGIPTYFGPGRLRRMHSDFYISPRKLRSVLLSAIDSTTR